MGDTTEQMEALKKEAVELSAKRGHELGAFKTFAGGAVSIALCNKCTRFGIAETYPSGHSVRGSALTFDCGGRKVENSI
jgi:hypothetical protein